MSAKRQSQPLKINSQGDRRINVEGDCSTPMENSLTVELCSNRIVPNPGYFSGIGSQRFLSQYADGLTSVSQNESSQFFGRHRRTSKCERERHREWPCILKNLQRYVRFASHRYNFPTVTWKKAGEARIPPNGQNSRFLEA